MRVDREKGIIYDVKVLGWRSQNGREYLPAGVNPKLYEGRKVCTDHPKRGQDRSTRDTVGWLEGITKQASGIYAKQFRLLNPKGDFEQGLMTAAESAPHLFGLSHNAAGRERPGSRGTVIEEVEHVNTVDVVDDPATVAGLYESRNPAMKKKLKELIESLAGPRPGYSRALREMAEAGVVSPDAMMDAPPDASANDGVDHKQALRDACKAIIDDDSLSEADMLKKIKAVLKLIKGKKADSPDEPDEPDEPADTEESRKRKEQANLREENARLKCRELLRTAADEAKVVLPKALLESVRPDLSEAEAKALVAEFRSGGGGSQRPRSAGPLPPQGGTGAVVGAPVRESKDDRKAIAARINGRG